MLNGHHLTRMLHTLAAAGFLLGALSGSAAAANSCVECHKDPIFRLHNHKLYTYYQDWLTSPHKRAGLTCDQCHGGDPNSDDPATAHEGVLGPSDPRSQVFYSNQSETCGSCHSEISKQFTKSKHYAAVKQRLAAPNCTTCHRAMNKKPYYHTIVAHTCNTCHSQEVHPTVGDLAEEILRRLNIVRGYLGWSQLYYSSQGWPDDSKQRLEALDAQYHSIMANGHSFDILSSDRDSAELLAQLMDVFKEAWARCHKYNQCQQLMSGQ